jgi:hypothetical protein
MCLSEYLINMNLKYLVKLRLKLSNIYLEKIPKEI